MGALTKTKVKQIDGLGDLALLDDIAASLISDASANGRSLITAANYAAMRGLLALGALATLNTITASLISDASANGRSLISAANYSAMRTLLGLAAIAASGSASDLGAGTVPMARLNVGSAANQLVALDGSARLPAVDGSQLTGIVPNVASAIAGLGVGAVGSHAFLRSPSAGINASSGSTLSGSSLIYTGVAATVSSGGASPSGTWRCLGDITSGALYGTLWVRIS